MKTWPVDWAIMYGLKPYSNPPTNAPRSWATYRRRATNAQKAEMGRARVTSRL
jgi:hypothetical protein